MAVRGQENGSIMRAIGVLDRREYRKLEQEEQRVERLLIEACQELERSNREIARSYSWDRDDGFSRER